MVQRRAAVIERDGGNPNHDFAVSRLRHRPVDEFEMIEAEITDDRHRTH